MSIIEEINNMMMIWEIKNFRREWVARYIAGLEARLENVELPPKEQVEADPGKIAAYVLYLTEAKEAADRFRRPSQ